MHKTIEEQLIEEESYLYYLEGKMNTTKRHLERVKDQQEVVRILQDTVRKIKDSLVINSDD